MIPSKRKNNFFQRIRSEVRHEPYLIINIVFTGVILLIIAYSGFFSPEKDNYPVACIHEKLTGQPCFSCGLSHSFSLIVRGRIEEAYQWNQFGMQVFLFFVTQLMLRVVFSAFYVKYPGTRIQLIILDSVGSGLLFLIAFWPFISNLISGIFQ
jgi:hypothetical protein